MLGCALALIMGGREEAQASPLGKLWPKRTAPVAAARAHETAVTRALPVLGTIRFPADEGGLAGGVRALRTEMQRFRNTALLRSIEQLLVAVTDRLRPGTQPPFVLLVSALRGGGERHLAAAAIGIGLDHIHQSVLVVDLVANSGQPVSPALAGLRAAPFVDPSSGLRTMIVDSASVAVPTAAQADGMIGHWVARSGTPADFVVIVDRPFGDLGRSAGLAACADLVVFALGPADLADGNHWLGGRLAPDERARSAAMVVEAAPGRTAADTRRPPVAANTEHPRVVVGQD
jgi:hypothetical protein